jgi:DNA polymerase V
MSQPLIGLLDCNNFFVSCERLFRPDLIGKPVVVLSSNDGCVVARSQEVKDMGVPMGVPYFQVKDSLQKAYTTTFSSNFTLYRDISSRVFSVMRSELDLVEQYSIDEAFFAVVDEPSVVAKHLKKVVEKEVGIPVSIGIAGTKTQAKYASKLAKKNDGVRVVSALEWVQLIDSIAIQDIWGVGGKMELRYKQYGLQTVADLVNSDPARISQIFGVAGLRLQQELQGTSVLPLQNKAQLQQSVMSSKSFPKATIELSVLSDALAYHVRHAVATVRAMGMLAGQIRVSISPSRHGDYVLRGGVKDVILSTPSSDTFEFLKIANQLLSEVIQPGVPYQKVGVRLGLFSPRATEQQTLFTATESRKNESIQKIVDGLNAKASRELLLLGSHLKGDKWQSRAEIQSPAYTTRWKDVAIVHAQ